MARVAPIKKKHHAYHVQPESSFLLPPWCKSSTKMHRNDLKCLQNSLQLHKKRPKSMPNLPRSLMSPSINVGEGYVVCTLSHPRLILEGAWGSLKSNGAWCLFIVAELGRGTQLSTQPIVDLGVRISRTCHICVKVDSGCIDGGFRIHALTGAPVKFTNICFWIKSNLTEDMGWYCGCCVLGGSPFVFPWW